MEDQGLILMTNPNHMPNDVFCLAPFYNIFYKGDNDSIYLAPCCESRNMPKSFSSFEEYWSSNILKEIKETMIANKPHAICNRCVSIEKSGSFSARKHYKNILNDLVKSNNLSDIININNIKSPIAVDYRGNNLCNFKCRMCHPSNSSEIAKEIFKNQKYEDINIGLNRDNFLYSKTKKPNDFFKSLPLNKIYRLKFLGGEPLIQDDLYEIIKYIEQVNCFENIILNITTNGSIMPEKFLKHIDKFKKVIIRISLDGVGDTFEYIRSNGKWNTILKNINLLLNAVSNPKKVSLGYNFVIQFYNAFNIDDIIQFCLSEEHNRLIHDNNFFFSNVEQDWLSLSQLYNDDYETVLSKVINFEEKYPEKKYISQLKNVIIYDNSRIKNDKEKLYRYLQEYTKVLDGIRNTKLICLDERYKKYE